jgi:serine/threonine-protein kinase SRK2
VQDGGRAAAKMMQPSKQSVEDVKRVVNEARKKPGLPNARADFNEEDYMDGELMDEEMHD